MSKLGIYTGTSPDDNTGDSLLSGAFKINKNFDEIYTFLGAGSTDTLSAPLWNKTTIGINTFQNVGIGTTNPISPLTVRGNINVSDGLVLIGSATSTGTANQGLQVTGGFYVSGSVGIGTSNPSSKLAVLGGDISVGINTSHGIILTSPNGTQYRLIVDDLGVLNTVSI